MYGAKISMAFWKHLILRPCSQEDKDLGSSMAVNVYANSKKKKRQNHNVF